MLHKLKSLTNSEEKKRLLSNFFSLSVLQGANYLLPLLTLPYLVRILGVEYFGLLAFSTAVVAYFQVFTDYGFNLTATRAISVNRDNKEKLVEIFNSVMQIKFLLMLVSFTVLCGLVFLIPKFKQNYEVFLLTFGMVIGQVVFPIWFFQGIERMKFITYINIGSKLAFTIAIFSLVKTQEDYWMVPLLNSLGAILGGFYALYLVISKFDIKFEIQSTAVVKAYLKDGWDVFLSRIYVNIYTTTNIVLLGLLTNNTVVGYYSVAEKIVTALSGLYGPVNQVAYPFFARIHTESKERFFRLFKKFNILQLASSIMLALIAYIFGRFVVTVIAGQFDENIYLVYSVLMLSVVTAPFGSSFTNGLLVIRENKLVSIVVRDTMFLNLILVFPAVYYFQALGLAVVYVIGQLFHVLYYLFRYNQALRLGVVNENN